MNGTLARRLLISRRDLDITQAALAAQAQVSPQYISDLERGRTDNPSVRDVQRIAEILHIRPEYLLGWSDDVTGEDRPGSVAEGRVVYEVASAAQYHRVQQLLALFEDLSWDYQELALKVIEEFGRAQQVRIVE